MDPGQITQLLGRHRHISHLLPWWAVFTRGEVHAKRSPTHGRASHTTHMYIQACITHTQVCITHHIHVHTGVHHTPYTCTHRCASHFTHTYTGVHHTMHTYTRRRASHHTHRCASHATHIHTGVRHTPRVHTGVHHTMHTYTGVHHTSHVCLTDHTHECSYVHRSGCALHTQAYTPHACTHVPPLGSCVDYVTGKGSTRGDGAGS